MLEVKELVKSYGTGKNQHRVLRGVNFTIHKGEFVAVMGPAGSGKTTLLDCISQYKPFESGEVLLDGVDLGKLNEKEMAGNRGYLCLCTANDYACLRSSIRPRFLYGGTLRCNGNHDYLLCV